MSAATWIQRLGHALRLALRALFALARPVAGFDRGLGRALRSLHPAGQAFAFVIARAHRGSAQDYALLYLAGLALLLVAGLFGS